jgi:hypothetical protein
MTSQDLPIVLTEDTLSPDDKIIIDNIITGLESLGSPDLSICKKYKITQIPKGYMISVKLPSQDTFEVTLDDLIFLQSINPTRIENISIGRCTKQANHVELFIRVLNASQRIMVQSRVSFCHAIRKRRFEEID